MKYFYPKDSQKLNYNYYNLITIHEFQLANVIPNNYLENKTKLTIPIVY